MKTTIVTLSIVMASAFVACTKNVSSPVSPTSDNTVLAARHEKDEVVVEEPLEINIPQAVIDAFNTRYPGATNVEYTQEVQHGVAQFKVKFYQGAQRWIAFFMPDGTFISAQPH